MNTNVHFAKEFDALYVHYGQAIYACEILNTDIDNISGLSSQEGFGTLFGYAGEDCFYRTSDRPSPHNCYTSADRLISATQNLSYSRKYDDNYDGHYQFASDDETIAFPDTATHMEPGYETNKPWFDYNADEGVYYRYQYGDAQIDQLTGDQLKYDNVIFQLCECYPLDDHGYLAIEAEKGGTAYVFTKGTYEKCTWTKEDKEVLPAISIQKVTRLHSIREKPGYVSFMIQRKIILLLNKRKKVSTKYE